MYIISMQESYMESSVIIIRNLIISFADFACRAWNLKKNEITIWWLTEIDNLPTSKFKSPEGIGATKAGKLL